MPSKDIVMYFTEVLDTMLTSAGVSDADRAAIIDTGISRPNTDLGTFTVNEGATKNPISITSPPLIYIIKTGPDEMPVFTLVIEDPIGNKIIEQEVSGKVPPRSGAD